MLACRKLLPDRRGWPSKLAMGTEASQALQVLFCGEEFMWGFRFSQEALETEPDIEVKRLQLAGCIMTQNRCRDSDYRWITSLGTIVRCFCT